jgi:adenylate cyclase
MTLWSGRILVVDDDEFFRSMAEELLTGHGHEVRTLPDGPSALAATEKDPPDLILLDLIMKQMTGLEVLRILKANPATTDVPVLLLTVERSEENLVKGISMGAEDVLFKPLSSEELLLRVELALRRKLRLDRLTEVIRRHLDPSVAYQILQEPQKPLPLRRAHLAVLFADLRGYTSLSEEIEPEQTAELLNRLFEHLVQCVVHYGGTLDKFLGDGLMALFGAPIDYPDNENRAVCAALEMLEQLAALDPSLGPAAGQKIALGIGISCGEVVVGPLGSRLRSNYTAIGDTVNVAARLTALAQGREIIICKEVRKRLDPMLKVDILPPAMLKGKRKALAIYRIVPDQKPQVVLRRKT